MTVLKKRKTRLIFDSNDNFLLSFICEKITKRNARQIRGAGLTQRTEKIALLFSYWGIGRCFSVGGKMRTCFVEATSKCSAFLGTLNNQKIQFSDNLLCILYPYLTIVDYIEIIFTKILQILLKCFKTMWRVNSSLLNSIKLTIKFFTSFFSTNND